MNNIKRVLAILLAAVITMGMNLTAMAEENEDKAANTEAMGKITIIPPADTLATASNDYKIYKVFDASGNGTNISYRLVPGKPDAPEGFTVDKAGNVSYAGTSKGEALTQDDIDAIKKYVENDAPVATVTATGGDPVESENLANGYYFITTTTGTLVTISSTNPSAEVTDKNTFTTVVKSAGSEYSKDALNAIAAVGTSQEFTAKIKTGKGAYSVVFTDRMTDMNYNGDLKVSLMAGDGKVDVEESKETYSVSVTETGFKVIFEDKYIAGLEEGTELILNYSCKVTSDALSVNPATNVAEVTSGKSNSSTSQEIKVYNAKYAITKYDGNNQPLEGAGFVIARNEKAEAAAEGEDGTAEVLKYYQRTEDGINWVSNIDEATQYFSKGNGEVEAFTGLANGTYTVIEKTVPAGYNKAEDQTFTIKDEDYTPQNLNQTGTVINNAGLVLPNTGGIGTTLFTVIGTILVVGAGVMLVARRRMEII